VITSLWLFFLLSPSEKIPEYYFDEIKLASFQILFNSLQTDYDTLYSLELCVRYYEDLVRKVGRLVRESWLI